MGGTDKGLLPLAGRPMIEYTIASLAGQVGELKISANRNLERYRAYGYAVVADTVTGYSGPLAGIAAGLESARTELLLTAPCDGPWLPPDLCERLHAALLDGGADVCVAHDGERLQPVFGLYHRRLLPGILSYLADGDRKLHHWLQQQNHVTADFSDVPQAFLNVNTPEERARAEEKLRTAR
jgi:molybdopterin-guanine dinucleotide biosynthesis protein A